MDPARGEINIMKPGMRGIGQRRQSGDGELPLPGIEDGAVERVDEAIARLIHLFDLSCPGAVTSGSARIETARESYAGPRLRLSNKSSAQPPHPSGHLRTEEGLSP